MLPNNNFLNDLRQRAEESLLVNGDFIGRAWIARPNQGILQLTMTAREWSSGHYIVRVFATLRPGIFLYSQEQPANLKDRATRLEFNKHTGLVCQETATEIGTRFTHLDGAIGLKPCHGDKVIFIQQIQRNNCLCDIAGRIHYQAFCESMVLERCVEEFRIRLDE